MAGPTGTNGILPTSDHLDGCSAARTVQTREGLRPSAIPLADQSSSQAFRNHPDETRSCHMGNQGVRGHFGPQTPLRHPTSEPVSFQPPVQQPCAVAPGTQANGQEAGCSQNTAAAAVHRAAAAVATFGHAPPGELGGTLNPPRLAKYFRECARTMFESSRRTRNPGR